MKPVRYLTSTVPSSKKIVVKCLRASVPGETPNGRYAIPGNACIILVLEDIIV
jgi:hypothetical protein